jgi:hypothetical protein
MFIKKINTSRLLAYYKAERKRYNVSVSDHCWLFSGIDNLDDPYYIKEEIKYNEWKDFLNSIKAELDTREHVYKKNK